MKTKENSFTDFIKGKVFVCESNSVMKDLFVEVKK